MLRNIGVLLSARDLNLKSTLGQGVAALAAFEKSAQGVGRSLSASAARAQAFRKVGTIMLATGGAVAAGLALAVSAFAKFDQQMSHVQAVTQASAGEMEQLRSQALRLGESTVFTANQVAQAQEELAKAGFSTTQVLKALPGVLDLAAAGEIELAAAAELTATTLNAFNLNASESTRVADTLAAGSLRSAASVDELRLGLQQSAQMSNAFGLSVEEATGVLALFSNEGLRGSDAGTSLRTMLTRLIAPMGRGAQELERLGVAMSDANGEMRPLGDIMDDLIVKWDTMTEAERLNSMSKIGGADAQRALIAIYNEGVGGIDRATEAVTQNGIAAQVAADRTNNLVGDIEKLAGAFQTALIEAGSGANDSLRFIVQTVTDAIGVFSALPGPVQQGIVALAGLAGATLLVGGLVAKLAAMNATLAATGPIGARAAAGISLLGTALARLTIAGAVVGGLLAIREVLGTIDDEIKRTDLSTLENQLLDLAETGEVSGATLRRVFDGIGLDPESARQTKADLDALDDALAQLAARDPEAAARSFRLISDALEEAGASKEQIRAAFDTYREALAQTDTANRTTAGTVGEVEAALAGVEGGLEEVISRLQAYQDELAATYDPIFAAVQAYNQQRDAVQNVRDAEAALQEARASGDPAAIAAAELALRDARIQGAEAVVALESASARLADAVRTGAVDVDTAQQQFLDLAAAMGVPRDVALAMANTIFPVLRGEIERLDQTDATVLVKADTEQAKRDIAARKDQLFDWDASEGTSDVNADGSQADATFIDKVGKLLGWDRSSGTASVNADGSQADRTFFDKVGKLLGWDRSSGSADVNAKDNASGILRNVGALLSGLDGRTATTYVTTIHSQVSRVIDGRYVVRGGGIWDQGGSNLGMIQAAQHGTMWQAGLLGAPTILAGERPTGGEAFIPRYGNPNRSRMILATAAGWYGMQMVPQGGGSGGGRGDIVLNSPIYVQISAKSILNERTLVEAIRDTTRYELAEHDRKLLRSLKSR